MKKLNWDRIFSTIAQGIELTLVFVGAIAIMAGLKTCTGQTVGSTFGYNGGLYTTIEVGYQHKRLSTALYFAIPYWRSGDMNYQGKLYGYKQLGYFAGLRVQFVICKSQNVLNKLFIGGALQYERYNLSLHSLATYPDAIKRGALKQWKVAPYGCIDYRLHPCIYAGCNLGKLSDIHVRFRVKINKDK